MTDKRVRVGVVGVGYFGRFHALKLARHPRAWLRAIADPDPARAVEVAAETGANAYTSHDALFDQVDAVSIATPAALHAAIAGDFLEAGIHVLVEKPLATCVDDADRLIALAESKSLIIQVGHQERAVLAAAGLFAIAERPSAIHCVRKGPYTGRNTDVDAVLDLMTHDLDMALALAPGEITAVSAKGRVARSAEVDEAQAILTLAGGTRLTFEASRIHDQRERIMRIDYPSGRLVIDFLARRVDNTTRHPLGPLFPAHDDHSGVAGDPLGFALDRFLAAVNGEGPPLVSGRDARPALVAAERIRQAIGRTLNVANA